MRTAKTTLVFALLICAVTSPAVTNADSDIGVKACLIGQTLCENENIEDKFKELFGED